MAYRQDGGSAVNNGATPSFYNDFFDNHNYLVPNLGGSAAVNVGANNNATNPGQVSLEVSGAFGSSSLRYQSVFTVGGGVSTLNNVVKIPVLGSATDRISLQIGYLDGFGGFQNGDPTNGIYFQYVDNVNSGQWQCITKAAGVATTTNTSTAANTSFNNFSIVINSGGTSVGFYINGSLVATNTTNIPSALLAVTVSLGIGTSSGATMSALWDMVDFNKVLTTPRF